MRNPFFASVRKASQITGYSTERLRRLAQQGHLTARKLQNTRWLIDVRSAMDDLSSAACPLCGDGQSSSKPYAWRDVAGRYWHQECLEKAIEEAQKYYYSEAKKSRF